MYNYTFFHTSGATFAVYAENIEDAKDRMANATRNATGWTI